jgi:hypothetical protein
MNKIFKITAALVLIGIIAAMSIPKLLKKEVTPIIEQDSVIMVDSLLIDTSGFINLQNTPDSI